jgi:EAL domain-containing protein (putative c-di-GMP-specific phosphodiesterase class I)
VAYSLSVSSDATSLKYQASPDFCLEDLLPAGAHPGTEESLAPPAGSPAFGVYHSFGYKIWCLRQQDWRSLGCTKGRANERPSGNGSRLEERGIFLEYLPIVELDNSRCVGAEALTRWRRPWGTAQPAEFVRLIEETPFSGYLTYWVLEQIAADFLSWLKSHDAYISFNVPPEIIGRGALWYLAERAGLIEIKHRLVIEITERGVPDRIGVEALNFAVDLGVRLALDDVGSAANVIVLSRCNVEMVKIDRALVAQVRSGEPLPAGLETIASLARTNKLGVVAERVESADQAEVLKQAGIPLAQGYYFSQLLSADSFKTYFTAHTAR